VKEFSAKQEQLNALFALKHKHSLAVLQNALEIAAHEKIFQQGAGEADRILLLSALYHDIGRFLQLERYHTFNDADSIDHARLGAKLLGEARFLTEENQKNRSLVRLTVLMHNRFALPKSLHKSCEPICQALRDADKLDIFKVLCAELANGHTPDPTIVLNLADNPAAYSPRLLDDVMQGKQVLYKDMRYINDFRILLCSWFYSLVFETSRTILARSGLLEKIIANLPKNNQIKLLRKKILNDLVVLT
jgi:hypothetical protein